MALRRRGSGGFREKNDGMNLDKRDVEKGPTNDEQRQMLISAPREGDSQRLDGRPIFHSSHCWGPRLTRIGWTNRYPTSSIISQLPTISLSAIPPHFNPISSQSTFIY